MNQKISKNFYILIYYFLITIGKEILGNGLVVGKINGYLSSESKFMTDPFSK